MKMSDISAIIKAMTGRMPESSRYLLAHKFVEKFRLDLQKRGDILETWMEQGGPQQFFAECEIRSGPPWVHHEISVHDSDLATFINRWMNVDSFRRPGEKDFVPVTPDMNSFRVTMVEELKQLAAAQERNNGVDDGQVR